MTAAVDGAPLAARAGSVLLVGVDRGEAGFDDTLAELSQLAVTAGLAPVGTLVCRRRVPDVALFVGSGKADEIRVEAERLGAAEVLFEQSLSPAQQRNLERHVGRPVNDRTLLILEIFAQRARSHEGKLQVELARLQYLSTRLVRRWPHLERQRGGIGTRGGPGETQIELDRRMITTAIARTKERLSRVKRQRQTQRRQRSRRHAFGVALVGYTNAGKSTLFNALVKARTYAADQLFATLDTTTRQLDLGAAEDGGRLAVALSDTVGFIRDLPHGLIEAFEATLLEAADADLLLHVVDASHPEWLEQVRAVQDVLAEIGAGDHAQVLVFNKLDALEIGRRPLHLQDRFEWDGQWIDRVFVSSRSGEGLEALRELLATQVRQARAGAGPASPDDSPQAAGPHSALGTMAP